MPAVKLRLFLVFVLLLPVVSHGGGQRYSPGTPSTCLSAPVIDTTCALYEVQTKVVNLAFTSAGWRLSRWDYYLVQDGKYQYAYPYVVMQMKALCEGQVPEDQLRALVRVLNVPLNVTWYEQRYNITGVLRTPASQVLDQYMRHYYAQRNCVDMLSAMLPCQCIYPPVAKVLIADHTNDMSALPLSGQRWLHDNATPGLECYMMQSILEGAFSAEPYNESMRLELVFFNQTNPHS